MRRIRILEALGGLRSPWTLVPAAGCACAALTLSFDAPLVVAALVGCVALLFLLLRPGAATLLTLFALYANLPVLAARVYGVPTLLAASAVLLLALPLSYHLVLRRERLRADRTFALMLLLLTVMTVSATLAPAPGLAAARLQVFVLEGIVLYWLVVNVVRDLPTFRRVLWTLLTAGALLGGLGAWQAVADSHGREFGGLAHRETEVVLTQQPEGEEATQVRVSNRASGPVDEPNRFGQILIVLLPLAVFCYRTAESRSAKAGAAATGALVLGGVVLTHSRGAFLVLVALAAAAMWVRWLRPRHVLACGLALVLALPVIAPTYRDRIASIGGARDLLEDQPNVTADGAIRGRTTEMLAALHVFLDHPVLGVGPGQYAPMYSVAYQTRPGVAFRDIRIPRRAHSLYLELAAETGALGLAVFLSMVALLLRDLNHARRRSASPRMSELATALAFSLAAYLGTAAFLHLSFERYFWLLLALVSAGLHVIRQSDARAASGVRPRTQLSAPPWGGVPVPWLPNGVWSGGSPGVPALSPAGPGGLPRALPGLQRPAARRRLSPRASRRLLATLFAWELRATVAELGRFSARTAHARIAAGHSGARSAWTLWLCRTRRAVAAAPGLVERRVQEGVSAAPTLARAWGTLGLAHARTLAVATNAQVEALGGAGLRAGRPVALWTLRAVDALGAAALAGGRVVASHWPAAALFLERAASRLAAWSRRAVRQIVTGLGPRCETLVARITRTSGSALVLARSMRATVARAASAAGSRYLFRALDALLTAPVAQDGRGSWGAVFVPLRQAHFKRVQTAANALDARWPRLALQIRERLVREDTLAFSSYGRPELLGYGAGSTVYRMPARDARGGDAVLKVLRRSLGRDTVSVFAEAREAQAVYRRIATLYAGADLVLPTRYLVLQAPLLGRPAAASLQPCLSGGTRDVFDYAEDELLDLLRQDVALAEQFLFFVRRTVESARGTHSCIDLVGRNNLLILATPEGPRMRLIDFGVMRLDDLLTRRPAVARELRRRIARLVRLRRALSREASCAPERGSEWRDSTPPPSGGYAGETQCPR